MEDVIAAKAEVIEVKRIQIAPRPGHPDPLSVVASVLQLEPATTPSDSRLAVHGTITVPLRLPFGETYTVIFRSDKGVPELGGRKFLEEA